MRGIIGTTKWRFGLLTVVIAVTVAASVVAVFETRSGSPAGAADPGITEPGLLKLALEYATGPGPIPTIDGIPTRIRGEAMTYGMAHDLLAHPMSPTASEYEQRNRPVFLFVFDGRVIEEPGPGNPPGTPPTIRNFLRLVIDRETSNLLYGESKSEPRPSLSGLPVIKLPANLDEVVARPTKAFAVATAAPPNAPETAN